MEMLPFRGDEKGVSRIVRTMAAGELWAIAELLGSPKSLIHGGVSYEGVESNSRPRDPGLVLAKSAVGT